MNTQNNFTDRAKSFINKVIRVRYALLRQGNKKDFADMEYAVKWLHTHINGLKFTDEQMAGFILKHQDKIIEIIPGTKAGNSESLLIEFQEFLSQAREFKSFTFKSVLI